MKKDISIPKVKDVYIAAVNAQSQDKSVEWAVYLINDTGEDLETVIVVSEGYSETKKTSTLRKSIEKLPQKSYAKIELLQEELFEFTNKFKVSYFIGNVLYDKTFVFKPNTISSENLVSLPLIEHKGILAG
jgi:hypothetical protein